MSQPSSLKQGAARGHSTNPHPWPLSRPLPPHLTGRGEPPPSRRKLFFVFLPPLPVWWGGRGRERRAGEVRASRIRTRLEHREEGLLGDLDRAHHLHALLAFLLLLEELALAGDVAAVALGGDVLAIGVDRRAGDDVAADRSLDGDLE